MDTFNAQCLCLKGIDYKDNDKLLTLYGEGIGKFTAVVKSCKSTKSKLKFATLPMTFANYEFVQKGGRNTVTGCEQIESFFDITGDIVKYSAACVALEFIDKTSMDNIFDAELFINTLKLLNALAFGSYDIKALLTRYINLGLAGLGYGQDLNLGEIKSFMERELDIKINSLEMFLNL